MLEDKATKNLGTSSLSSSHKNRSVLVPVSEHSFCTCCIVCLFHFQKKKNLFHYFKIGETFVFKLLKNVIAALQACCTVDLLNILYMSWSIVVHFRNLCYWRPHPTPHAPPSKPPHTLSDSEASFQLLSFFNRAWSRVWGWTLWHSLP